MDASERAERVEDLTWKVIEALAMEALRQHKRDEVPKWLGPRVISVVQKAGGTEDQARSVMDEILGLGPLEPLLRNPAITVIEFEGPQTGFVTEAGERKPSAFLFADDKHIRRVIGRILKSVGKEIGAPAEATLKDGSTIATEDKDGVVHVTIRRPNAA